MKRIVSIVVMLMAFLPGAPGARRNDTASVISLIKTYYRACADENMDAYLKCFADVPEERRAIQKRQAAEVWAATDTPSWKVGNFEVNFGEEGKTALATFDLDAVLAAEGSEGEESFDVHGRYAALLLREDGEWRIGLVQDEECYVANMRDALFNSACAGLLHDYKLAEKEDVERTSLISNGFFVWGTEGWKSEPLGWREPRDAGPASGQDGAPSVEEGSLHMGVYGGSHQLSQVVEVENLDLRLRAKVRLDDWPEAGKNEGSFAAVGVSFLTDSGKTLGTTYYYLYPFGLLKEREGIRWVPLGTEGEIRGKWYGVDAVLSDAARLHHDMDFAQISRVKIRLYTCGKYEESTPTVASFAEISITPVGESETTARGGKFQHRTGSTLKSRI